MAFSVACLMADLLSGSTFCSSAGGLYRTVSITFCCMLGKSLVDPLLSTPAWLESRPETGTDSVYESEPEALVAALKRGRPPKNMQKTAAAATASTCSAHYTCPHSVVTNQDAFKPPTAVKGRKASNNGKNITIAIPTKCTMQSCSIIAAIPSRTTSKLLQGKSRLKKRVLKRGNHIIKLQKQLICCLIK